MQKNEIYFLNVNKQITNVMGMKMHRRVRPVRLSVKDWTMSSV